MPPRQTLEQNPARRAMLVLLEKARQGIDIAEQKYHPRTRRACINATMHVATPKWRRL